MSHTHDSICHVPYFAIGSSSICEAVEQMYSLFWPEHQLYKFNLWLKYSLSCFRGMVTEQLQCCYSVVMVWAKEMLNLGFWPYLELLTADLKPSEGKVKSLKARGQLLAGLSSYMAWLQWLMALKLNHGDTNSAIHHQFTNGYWDQRWQSQHHWDERKRG